MPTFTYQARDQQGRLVRGVLEAESQVSLADRLRKMGYLVTRMEALSAGLPGALTLRWGRGVSQENLLLCSIQLANLVEAGVPLLASLQAVSSQTAQGPLREALEAIARELEAGVPFSEALSHHPRVFPELLVRLAAVGEASGHLDTVLTRFAGFVEKDLALTRAVQGALLYPALLVAAATVLTLFLVTFVVPQFAGLFAKAGILLPLPTRILQAAGAVIRHHGLLLLFLAGAVAAGLPFLRRVPSVRLALDRWALRIPLAGAVIHQAAVARFARTLATLVASGVPIVSALGIARGVAQNQRIAQEIERVQGAVEQGERMAATLSVGGVFYPDAIQMIRVGEESGRLDVMLERISDFYELRVSYALKQATTVLEPVLLVAMGGVVAFIMASLLLPMFDMVKVLQRGGIR